MAGMNPGEIAAGLPLAARLIAAQFPHWGHLPPDDATWRRGRGWALGLGLGAIHHYRDTNPVLAAIGQHAVTETLTDYQHAT
jgi:hypothetical protein